MWLTRQAGTGGFENVCTCLLLSLLQVLIVTADEELLKSLREANRLLEQVRTHQQHCGHIY
jgi:hypothetical protein